MDIEKELTHVAFLNREYQVSHLAYDREMAFFKAIQRGDLETVHRLFKPLDSDKMGTLSQNPLRNLTYHFIITVAFLTRYCIEGGMEMEEAFNLSDIYIRSADCCQKEQEISVLHRQVIDDFTQRMQMIHKKPRYPKPILVALDYIYDHLHMKITLQALAEAVHLSPSHLSKLFHREMGLTISDYIRKKRVEAAGNMLKFSDYSCAEIANYLCFSSESHFIQIFKKEMGKTPKQYRELFFRRNWNTQTKP